VQFRSLGLAHQGDFQYPLKYWGQGSPIACGWVGWNSRTSDEMWVPEQKSLRNFLVWHTKSQKGIFPIPFIPPRRFIIFIMPPPFIFFIMSCICSNSFSMRLTSCT